MMKKNKCFFIVTVLALALFFLVSGLQSSYAAGQIEIRILHFNDFHGFAQPYKPFGENDLRGGIDFLAGRVNELSKEKPTLLLAAGDFIQGNNWANFSKGKSSIELMNLMKVDALVIGNHEFDFGQETLKERIAEAKFPVLGANVEGFPALKPYAIKEVGGIKVGIIGVITVETPQTTHPRNVIGLTFTAPETAVAKYVEQLRSKVNLIVVLSHLGYEADKALAQNVKGIDLIVGGHSHTKLEKGEQIGRTLIVQAWEHAKALGVVDLIIQDNQVSASQSRLDFILPASGTKDETVAALVGQYAKQVDATLSEKIGEALVDMDSANIRKKETNLGDLIADILRQTAGADLAITNSGGIRTSIAKGPLKVSDVYNVVPFDNYILSIKLTGKQIKEALENGVSAVEEGKGKFPQVSGFSFAYAPAAPKGERVKEITVAGAPLNPDKQYTVATIDFMAAGGDGYTSFGEAVKAAKDYESIGGSMKSSNIVYNDPGKWLRDVVVEYVKARKTITAQTEGRIREVN
jgi:2',3'-cyclic-nucleotide 2'-phosphodiesterase (5'-nucleotidase family)